MSDYLSEPTVVAQLILAHDAAFAAAADALAAAPSRPEEHQHHAPFGVAGESHRAVETEGSARQISVRP